MTAVIGDIHGCLATLEKLLNEFKKKYPSVPLYCVGDLIDRGNNSLEVIELIKSENIKFTPGNHDYMFYYFIKSPESEIGRAWLYNGYEKTLASYDNKYEKIAEHLDFIIQHPLFLDLPDCFISHAGISSFYKKHLPENPLSSLDFLEEMMHLEIDSDHGILWNRDTLLNAGKLQVVGHTRQRDIKFVKETNSLYIDTSVYTGNKLSVALIEKGEIIDSISVPTYPKDIS